MLEITNKPKEPTVTPKPPKPSKPGGKVTIPKTGDIQIFLYIIAGVALAILGKLMIGVDKKDRTAKKH